MKIKIISADVVYDENYKDERVISFVDLKWQEKNGVIMKKKFSYKELHSSEFILRAFKNFYPEFYL